MKKKGTQHKKYKEREYRRRVNDPNDKVKHHTLFLRESMIKRWPRSRVELLIEKIDEIRTNYSNFGSLLKDLETIRELREKGISKQERGSDSPELNQEW